MSRWGIVGGGLLGSTLALRLAEAGEEVTLFEAAPQLGGLASAWTLGDVVWDRHYHVTLLSDAHTRGLLRDLGLEQEMRWVETKTGSYFDGSLHSISDTIDYIRFPPLSVSDKARLAATILRGARIKNWRRLEQLPVEQWLRRWSGDKVFDRFWLPLLQAKLGDAYRDTSAAFIWATIQRLYAARNSGLKKEMFGYVEGGYARVLARLGEALGEAGVDVRLDSPVTEVTGDRQVITEEARDEFDRVVLTTPAPVAADIVRGLSDDSADRLRSIRYQGIVCASMLTARPLADYYLTYLHDPAPFTAVVEMSAFVDRSSFGGRSLVYLPKYCSAEDDVFGESDASIRERFLGHLGAMYPSFRRDDVLAFRVSRVKNVYPISTIGYSETVPAFDTELEGIHLVSSAQIVNGTLNVNETVALANRGVAHLLDPVSEVMVG